MFTKYQTPEHTIIDPSTYSVFIEWFSRDVPLALYEETFLIRTFQNEYFGLTCI